MRWNVAALVACQNLDPVSAALARGQAGSAPVVLRRAALIGSKVTRLRWHSGSDDFDVVQKSINRPGYDIACWSTGHLAETTIMAESAARIFAVALGTPYDSLVPAAAIQLGRSGRPVSVVMEWRQGQAGRKQLKNIDRAQLRAAALFDYLIGQQDRHKQNFFWDASTRQLSLIDHAYAFGGPWSSRLQSRLERTRRRDPHERELDQAELATLDRLVGSGNLLGMSSFLASRASRAMEKRARRMISRKQI